MQLKVLSYNDVEQARIWRNDNLSMNRTPYHLTKEQQSFFYQDVVCDRKANFRYWGIWEEVKKESYKLKMPENYLFNTCSYEVDVPEHMRDTYIGMGEITNISLENRNGEIGLIMHPGHVNMADKAIELILEQGFNYLNLENVYGEVYECSAYLEMWKTVASKFNANSCYLPCRKFWEGKYYDSTHFTINKGDWKECQQ